MSAAAGLTFGAVAACLALAVGCSGDAFRGAPLDRARAAYARGDWPDTGIEARRQLERDPKDVEATRLLARSLARQGQGNAAVALAVSVGAERLDAEDLFLLGKSLATGGRVVLAWAAYDAATKLDPKNREASAALAALHGKIETLGDAVHEADRFTAVPSGPALAQLVVGVLSVEKTEWTPGKFDPWLDKIIQLERPVLLKLDGAAAARRLIARFLLEEARPAEARAWIAADKNQEAAWLRSRAFLDEGLMEPASAELEKAGTFGVDEPIAFEPSPYAGSKRCAECHGANYKAEQSSRHATTIGSGDALKAVPLPNGPVSDPAEAGVVHRFSRDGSTINVASTVGDETFRGVVAYALGSGHHGQTFLTRDAKAKGYRSLRISYYTGGNHWDITSGFDPHPDAPDRFLGELMVPSSFRACLHCHMTRFRSEDVAQGPEAADRGLGCERCHGPGERHIKAVEAGFPQLAIGRPKAATPAKRMQLCAPCHGADGTIPPSDPRFIRFQSTTLPYSRCYTETGGKLDCVTCHDPHKNVETSPAYYEARCLSCHGPGAPSGHDPAIRVDAVAAVRCKVNPKDGCLNCHMPKSDNVIPFTSFTDHHIRVHKPGDKVAGP